MELLETLRNRARAQPQRIVLTDGEDDRIIRAAAGTIAQGYAKPTLLGRPSIIRARADRLSVRLGGIDLLDPSSSPRVESYAEILFEQRRASGMTFEEAYDLARKPPYFAALRVAAGEADGALSGAASSTSEVVGAALDSIGLAPDGRILSSFSLMALRPRSDGTSFGYQNCLLLADGAVVSEPSAENLADIAIATAQSARLLWESEPRVALLSSSTKGSAGDAQIEKVRKAVRVARVREPDLLIDGELPADAALVGSIAAQDAPGSPVGGRASVLIFPDRSSASIASGLVEHLVGALAIGPLLQGLARPANALSRTCSAEHVAHAIAVTSVQAIRRKEVAQGSAAWA